MIGPDKKTPPKSSIRALNLMFDDRYSGPVKRILKSAQAMRNLGVVLEIAIPDRGGNAEIEAQREGVAVYRIKIRRFPKLSKPFHILRWALGLPLEIIRIGRFLHRNNPDIVNLSGAFFIAPAIAARLLRIPLVWHLNDTVFSMRISFFLGFVVRALANCVVAQGEAVADHYRLPKGTYELVYSHVDTNHFAPLEVPRSDRKTDIHHTARVGIIANWSPLKGLEYFLEAAKRIRASVGSDVRFVIVGARLDTQQEYADRIEAVIMDNGLSELIECKGFVADPAEIVQDLDILVMSSVSEACPNVVLEGMSAGVAVVATDVGCVRELLEPNNGARLGIVVPVKDPEALANAVLELLADRPQAVAMGLAARQSAKLRFTVGKYAEAHAQIYRDVLNPLRHRNGS